MAEKRQATQNLQPTSLGIGQNIEGMLSYILGPITGIIFLIIERDNRFVRFHAMQSLLFSLAMLALSVIISMVSAVFFIIPFIGVIIFILLKIIYVVIGLFLFIIWVYVMYKALDNKIYKLPYIGRIAEHQLDK